MSIYSKLQNNKIKVSHKHEYSKDIIDDLMKGVKKSSQQMRRSKHKDFTKHEASDSLDSLEYLKGNKAHLGNFTDKF